MDSLSETKCQLSAVFVSCSRVEDRGSHTLQGAKVSTCLKFAYKVQRMNPVLVTGGKGHLGNLVVQSFSKLGQPVRVLTRQDVSSDAGAIQYYKGDLAGDIGLEDAVKGVDTIVHCASNAGDFENADIKGTRNLLKVLDKAHAKHFLYISIVGVDRSDYPYYQAKRKVEQIIASSGVPYTIVRATQFHGFVLNLIRTCVGESVGDSISIPASLRFQPVDSAEVADLAASLSLSSPCGLYPDVGGPEVRSFDSMVESFLKRAGIDRRVQAIHTDNARHNLFRSGVNLCPGNKFGKTTFEDYLEQVL